MGLRRCHDSGCERRAGMAGDRSHRHEEGFCEPVMQVQEVLRRDSLSGQLF